MSRLQELTRHYETEANWPPMNWIPRALWRHLTPGQRAQTGLAPRVWKPDSPFAGMTLNDP